MCCRADIGESDTADCSKGARSAGPREAPELGRPIARAPCADKCRRRADDPATLLHWIACRMDRGSSWRNTAPISRVSNQPSRANIDLDRTAAPFFQNMSNIDQCVRTR
jgi:hypothetical protein